MVQVPLLLTPGERLGSRGVDEIKNHPFFKGVDWDKIRETQAPNIPNVAKR